MALFFIQLKFKVKKEQFFPWHFFYIFLDKRCRNVNKGISLLLQSSLWVSGKFFNPEKHSPPLRAFWIGIPTNSLMPFILLPRVVRHRHKLAAVVTRADSERWHLLGPTLYNSISSYVAQYNPQLRSTVQHVAPQPRLPWTTYVH